MSKQRLAAQMDARAARNKPSSVEPIDPDRVGRTSAVTQGVGPGSTGGGSILAAAAKAAATPKLAVESLDSRAAKRAAKTIIACLASGNVPLWTNTSAMLPDQLLKEMFPSQHKFFQEAHALCEAGEEIDPDAAPTNMMDLYKLDLQLVVNGV